MNLIVLYLEYGQSHRQKNWLILSRFFARVFPGAKISGFVIDNSGTDADGGLGPLAYLRGDNRQREFSGWQVGINALQLQGIPDDAVVCLVNDTFARHYGSNYLRWFDLREVKEALLRGEVVGYIDRFRKKIAVGEISLGRYIRTSLFLLRWKELKQILPLNPEILPEKFYAQGGERLFAEKAPMSENLKKYLECWLCFGPPVPGEFETRWHSAEKLSAETRAKLQHKATSILHEVLLSGRLQAAGIKLFNVRTSKSRAFGLFWMLEKIGFLETLQEWRAKFMAV